MRTHAESHENESGRKQQGRPATAGHAFAWSAPSTTWAAFTSRRSGP